MAKGRKTGGRQAGTLNAATREIRDASRALLEDSEYQATRNVFMRADLKHPAKTALPDNR
jgi:hypothetical protein